MSKDIAEQTNRLSVFFLKKHGYLSQDEACNYGGITWSRGDWSNNINFWVATSGSKIETIDTSYVRLIYTITIRRTGEKTDMDYKIPLITTRCNYGAKRYWFKCNLYKNGVYCGRRVGVIYSVDKWFGCRHCARIAYQSQMYGGRYKGFVSVPDIEEAEKKVKRYYYRGKPTRKYRKVIKLNDKFENGLLVMASKLDKRFSRFTDP